MNEFKKKTCYFLFVVHQLLLLSSQIKINKKCILLLHHFYYRTKILMFLNILMEKIKGKGKEKGKKIKSMIF